MEKGTSRKVKVESFYKRNINRLITKPTIFKVAFFLIICLSVGFNKFSYQSPIFQTEPWVAPSNANQIKNPFVGDKKSVDAGKILYTTYCVVCHGEKGKGDGAASLSIPTKPADHTSVKIQKQSDGAIFWKLTEGRPAVSMISYKFVLTDVERWQLVNYIRTLAVK